MATALIGSASFNCEEDGTAVYTGEVYFKAGTPNFIHSTIRVALGAGDTLSTLQGKFLAAMDAEAQRLGLAAPTAVYGGSVIQLR